MVKKGEVADAHHIAHEIARLIVSDAIPCHCLVGHGGKVVYGTVRRFGLHEPVAHYQLWWRGLAKVDLARQRSQLALRARRLDAGTAAFLQKHKRGRSRVCVLPGSPACAVRPDILNLGSGGRCRTASGAPGLGALTTAACSESNHVVRHWFKEYTNLDEHCRGKLFRLSFELLKKQPL